MSARPSWNFDDINPKVRERAEDSAKRAGMTVGDWLNATIGDAAAGLGRSPFDTREPVREHMNAQQRLDAIAKQFDSSKPARSETAAKPEPARHDPRLSDYAEASASERNANPYGPRSSGAVSLEAAIAEISARQRELATAPPAGGRTMVSTSKLSTLERQISHIMVQMDSMPNPVAIEQSIASFRADLNDIRKAITEAVPRKAIESIESEIRTLSQRVDESRQRGADAGALASVEMGLDQIRESLKGMMSAEQLAGFDGAIKNLSGQLESVVRGGNDAAVLNELEEAISSLRVIVSKVASNETLDSLGGDVRSLASKLDEFAHAGGFGDSLAALETRIVSLASFLQKRDREGGHTDGGSNFETALRELSERIDNLPSAKPADAGLDTRMSNLLDRLEAISSNPSIQRVEEGLADIRHQLEERRMVLANAESLPMQAAADPALVETMKRELADIRLNLTASERHTLESIEVVNNTLGHVVDRLAMIEGDLRGQAVAPKMPATPLAAAAAAIAQSASASAARPEMPNPAAYYRPLQEMKDTPPLAPRAPDLPPDTPLEPGTRSAARMADEIEAFVDEQQQDGATTSSFIAAARRAARAAAAAAPEVEKDKRAPAKPSTGGESSIASKIRSLLVGASVVVIVIGSFRMAMSLLDGAPPPSTDVPAASAPAPAPLPGKQSSMMEPAPKSEPALNIASPAASDITGSINAQAQVDSRPVEAAPVLARANVPANETLPESIGTARLRDAALKGDAGAAFEVGARYAEARGVVANFQEAAKWYDRAAQAGLPTAAFRLGAMYEKGLGVKKDLDAARRFYSQAADRGFAKAMHNLAVLDADGGANGANFKSASMWFRKAAERGVVDSQYNLGILYARGIGVEQNLAESFKWFSLAASQGDADSAAKRDEVAKKIDPQSLAAAKLAIQTFTPEPQPAEATNLAIPAGGWDVAPQQTANAKPTASVKKAAAR